jgi:hypothetical protein
MGAVKTVDDAVTDALIEGCWTIRFPSGQTYTCGVYRTVSGDLELQLGYLSHHVRYTVMRQPVADTAAATAVARRWRTMVLRREEAGHSVTQ